MFCTLESQCRRQRGSGESGRGEQNYVEIPRRLVRPGDSTRFRREDPYSLVGKQMLQHVYPSGIQYPTSGNTIPSDLRGAGHQRCRGPPFMGGDLSMNGGRHQVGGFFPPAIRHNEPVRQTDQCILGDRPSQYRCDHVDHPWYRQRVPNYRLEYERRHLCPPTPRRLNDREMGGVLNPRRPLLLMRDPMVRNTECALYNSRDLKTETVVSITSTTRDVTTDTSGSDFDREDSASSDNSQRDETNNIQNGSPCSGVEKAPMAVPRLCLLGTRRVTSSRTVVVDQDDFEVPLAAPRARPMVAKPTEVGLPQNWGDGGGCSDRQHQKTPGNALQDSSYRGCDVNEMLMSAPSENTEEDCGMVTLRSAGVSVRVPSATCLQETDVRISRRYTNSRSVDSIPDTINSGTFCKVFRASYGNRLVAVKCPDSNYLSADPLMAHYRAVQEWRILSRANHQNILGFIGGVDAGREGIWLVTEYVTGGDLYALLHLRPSALLQPVVRLRMIKQITDSIAYLHNLVPKVVHKDIKTNNILVDEHLNLKLCDFGDAEEMVADYVQRYTAATWQYAPPEIFGADEPSQPLGTTEKVDIWALGCVFLEICLAPTPLKHLLENVPDAHQRDFLRQRLLHGLLEFDIKIPSYFPPSLTSLLRGCFVIDSTRRASATQIKSYIMRNEGVLLREIEYTQRLVEAALSAGRVSNTALPHFIYSDIGDQLIRGHSQRFWEDFYSQRMCLNHHPNI